MSKTSGSRSILLALGLGFSLAAACFDESVLENEDCASNSDCASGQKCVRTDYQAERTTEQFGWCRPSTSCAAGSQPGCACEVTGAAFTCEKHESAEFAVCPSSQDNDCTCVFPSDIDASLTDNLYCPT